MDSNKKEAIRSRLLAEKRMQKQDFLGAKKLAVKAQNFCPHLENIAQLLTVCEVHVSARLKFGSEMDWYGILNVPEVADEMLIRKQFLNLTLLLHPDKNKYPGAEDAFKLVVEAQRVLSDHVKRSAYNMKRSNSQTSGHNLPPQPDNSSYTWKPKIPKKFRNHRTSQFPSMNQTQQQQKRTPPTFWTACPKCNRDQHCYITVLNRYVLCQRCSLPFVAAETFVQGGPPGTNYGYAQNQSSAPQHIAGQQSTVGTTTGMQCQGNDSRGVTWGAGRKRSKFESYCAEVNRSDQKVEPSNSVGRKRERKAALRSAAIDDSDGTDVEAVAMQEDFASHNAKGTKQNVTFYKNESDNDFMISPSSKRLNNGVSLGLTDDQSNCVLLKRDGKEKEDFEREVKDKKEDSSEIEMIKEISSEKGFSEAKYNTVLESNFKLQIDYPEPEFHDFDKDRGIDHIKENQIWAVYDDSDGMPRFYVRVRKVYSHKLKLQFTWLEANPQDEDGQHWHKRDLPIACGNFKCGMSELTKNLSMFSHLASWEKGETRGSYKIYPKKGDVWALFKDWSVQWSSSPKMHRKYEFEYGEILSDYDEGTGIDVASLVMLEGFTSLFHHTENMEQNLFRIPLNELLRFSHRVPCYRMSGQGKIGVPEGSFELDPASVYFENFSPSNGVDKVLDKDVDIQSDTKWSKSGTANEMLATSPRKLNIDKISPDENNIHHKERLDNGIRSESSPVEDQLATVSGKLHKSEIVSPDKKNIPNEDNLDSRRHSLRNIEGAHDKHTQANESHVSEQRKTLHGVPGSRDITDDKLGFANLTKCQADDEEKNLGVSEMASIECTSTEEKSIQRKENLNDSSISPREMIIDAMQTLSNDASEEISPLSAYSPVQCRDPEFCRSKAVKSEIKFKEGRQGGRANKDHAMVLTNTELPIRPTTPSKKYCCALSLNGNASESSTDLSRALSEEEAKDSQIFTVWAQQGFLEEGCPAELAELEGVGDEHGRAWISRYPKLFALFSPRPHYGTIMGVSGSYLSLIKSSLWGAFTDFVKEVSCLDWRVSNIELDDLTGRVKALEEAGFPMDILKNRLKALALEADAVQKAQQKVMAAKANLDALKAAEPTAPSMECLVDAAASEGALEKEVTEIVSTLTKAQRKLEAVKVRHEELREQKAAADAKRMEIEAACREWDAAEAHLNHLIGSV